MLPAIPAYARRCDSIPANSSPIFSAFLPAILAHPRLHGTSALSAIEPAGVPRSEPRADGAIEPASVRGSSISRGRQAQSASVPGRSRGQTRLRRPSPRPRMSRRPYGALWVALACGVSGCEGEAETGVGGARCVSVEADLRSDRGQTTLGRPSPRPRLSRHRRPSRPALRRWPLRDKSSHSQTAWRTAQSTRCSN